MPTVRPLREEERSRLRGPGQPKVDLGPYMQMLDGYPLDDWFIIELEEGEKPNSEKRRFTAAAKQLGHRLIYAQTKNTDGIRAKLTDTPVNPRGPRNPKPQDEEPAEVPAVRGRRAAAS